MKDSGVVWIGEIPDDWEVIKTKNVFRNVKRIVGEQHWDCERLALTLNGVIKRNKDEADGLQPEKFDTYQFLYKNELVFKLIDLGNIATSRVGLSPFDGMVSPAYIILHNDCSDNRFYYYYYLSMWHRNIFNSLGDNGVRSSIGANDLLNLPIVDTNEAERIKIADFLDKKCAEIDCLIAHEETMIDELKAYKQSVIAEAVTKGLDRTVPMKDSGVEWIGEIPEHWATAKLKNVCKIFGRIGFRGYRQDDMVNEGEGAITLSPSNMRDTKMNYEKCSYLSWEKYFESPEIQIHNGDILFVKTGSTFGKVALVDNLLFEATVNPQIIVLKNFTILNKYLCYSLCTPIIRAQVDCTVVGGTIPTISQEKIYNYSVLIPPTKEQQQIAEYLDRKCSEIDRLISLKQEKIEELREYKKSLIYEYVTGKKEVV